MDNNVYGRVNGEAIYNIDEFKYKSRGFGEIKTDEELLEFSRKITGDWSCSGHKQKFSCFYLGSYCLNEPCRSLTKKEYDRLKELQKKAKEELKKEEEEKCWKKIKKFFYADNSEVEIWQDKYGNQKEVVVVGAHGDACY